MVGNPRLTTDTICRGCRQRPYSTRGKSIDTALSRTANGAEYLVYPLLSTITTIPPCLPQRSVLRRPLLFLLPTLDPQHEEDDFAPSATPGNIGISLPWPEPTLTRRFCRVQAWCGEERRRVREARRRGRVARSLEGEFGHCPWSHHLRKRSQGMWHPWLLASPHRVVNLFHSCRLPFSPWSWPPLLFLPAGTLS